MTSVPGGTLTGAPSIVRLIKPSAISRLPSADHYRLAFACEIGLEFASEFLDPTHDRSGAGIRENTDRFSRHVFREIQEQVEVLSLALSRQNALHDPGGPGGALAALGALRARLMRIETGEAHDLIDHVGRVVEHDHAARAEHRALCHDAFVVAERCV